MRTGGDDRDGSRAHGPTAPIALRVLGNVELASARAGSDALLGQPKRLALLVYVATARPRGMHRRDRLVEMFWPEQSQEHARAALRKSVWAIRQSLGDDVIRTRGDEELGCDPAVVAVDAAEFDVAIAEDRLARALELYRGDLLDGFHADAPGFERWLEDERRRYRDAAAQAAWSLAERYERGESLTLAARWARRVPELAPADERALRKAMLLLERAGDRAGAVQVYESFARRLRADFEVEPSGETRGLVERLRRG
jgi:DNA-binding SARP family transcriptional activator